MSNINIAIEIYRQLGQNRLDSMIGIQSSCAIENGLQIRFKAKANKGINVIRIQLNQNDLYDIEFLKIRGINVTSITKENDVYAEDMKRLIEQTTGLYLSL
jgi:hypothetical protein